MKHVLAAVVAFCVIATVAIAGPAPSLTDQLESVVKIEGAEVTSPGGLPLRFTNLDLSDSPDQLYVELKTADEWNIIAKRTGTGWTCYYDGKLQHVLMREIKVSYILWQRSKSK